jgi:hypothetical protein
VTGWHVYLGMTMTGALGPELDVVRDVGYVKHVLNGHDDTAVDASIASLDGVGREWRSVRAGCLVFTYTDEFDEERIISATPICKPLQQNRRAGTVRFEGKGPTWLLEDRVLLNQDYQPSDFKGLRKSIVGMAGRSFRAIISRILRHTVMEKRQGYLPLVLPSETERGIHERTYEGFNLSNNGAWKLIQEITEVIGGPDIQFRPRWANKEHTRFEWVVLVGTDAQQTLVQNHEIQWDATMPGSEVATLDVTSSTDRLAHRVYATGAGEGASTALSMAEMQSIPDYMPLVEKVISVSDEEMDDEKAGTSKLLTSKAKTELDGNAMDQLTLSVHADPRDQPIGTWWCGEQARIRTSGWLDVPDGEHHLRIIATSYNLGSDMVDVECQEDYLGEDLEW